MANDTVFAEEHKKVKASQYIYSLVKQKKRLGKQQQQVNILLR